MTFLCLPRYLDHGEHPAREGPFPLLPPPGPQRRWHNLLVTQMNSQDGAGQPHFRSQGPWTLRCTVWWLWRPTEAPGLGGVGLNSPHHPAPPLFPPQTQGGCSQLSEHRAGLPAHTWGPWPWQARPWLAARVATARSSSLPGFVGLVTEPLKGESASPCALSGPCFAGRTGWTEERLYGMMKKLEPDSAPLSWSRLTGRFWIGPTPAEPRFLFSVVSVTC